MGWFNLLSSAQATEHQLSFDLKVKEPSASYSKRPIVLSPMNVARVPTEIVLSILEVAYYDDHMETDEKLLKSCSLVCHEWSMLAQKLLFRTVTLRTQPAYHAFRKAVDRSTERGRELGDAVVRMRLVLDHNQPLHLHPQSFARAVTLCPNLYELDVSLFGSSVAPVDRPNVSENERTPRFSFDKHTLDLLCSGPKVRALSFSNWTADRAAASQLISLYPSVTHLSLSGTTPPAFIAPLSSPLTSLHLNFQCALTLETLKALLDASGSSLETVEFAREPSVILLNYLTSIHGHTLQSISLPACGAHEHALALRKCAELKELVIESAWAAPMVYKALPVGMRHLAFGVDAETTLQPIIAAIRKGCHELEAVTVHLWDGAERNSLLPSLRIACAYRGVEFRVTKNVNLFRSLTRGDPVPVKSFPRVKSLSNLHAMRTAVASPA